MNLYRVELLSDHIKATTKYYFVFLFCIFTNHYSICEFSKSCKKPNKIVFLTVGPQINMSVVIVFITTKVMLGF